MASTKILDTHIHLWPTTACSPANHGWMTPGHFLSKRHGISDYLAVTRATSTIQPTAFIYVETDRYLPSPTPDISEEETTAISSDSNGKEVATQKLRNWAHEPLEELKFLRRIVEGTPTKGGENGDGFEPGDGDKMAGCVIWAPFNLPTELFDLYLQIAEETSGPKLWTRVVGFRYLLQAIRQESTMRSLILSLNWLQNILRLRFGRGGKGWAFDVGVDTHRGGTWQLEAAADMVEKVREMESDSQHGKVRFILNHLCKPDLSSPTTSTSFSARWLAGVARCAAQEEVYMKFSGGFNEFEPEPTPKDIPALFRGLEFYVKQMFERFGVERVMFGSDWPVCDVGGPDREGNWGLWKEVVEKAIDTYGFGQEHIWSRAGCRAYGVEPLG